MGSVNPWCALLTVLACLLAACGRGTAADGRGAPKGIRRAEALVGPLVLVVERGRAPRERVVIGTAGIALGAAGQPLPRYLFTRPERTDDARFLRATFAAFSSPISALGGGAAAPLGSLGALGSLRFLGRGPEVPDAAERRAIFEWMRLVAEEAAGGHAGAYGLALAWHRGGEPGAGCDDLAVYRTGEVRSSACGGGDGLRGRLAPEPLGRLFNWFDRFRSFQQATDESSFQGVPPTRLLFAGQGSAEAAAPERESMERFAADLQRELGGRRLPAATLPPPDSPAAPAAVAAPPPLAGSRLLRPESPSGGHEVLVPEAAMPKEPPPVPQPVSAPASTAAPPIPP